MAVMISCWRDVLLYQTLPGWENLAYVVTVALVTGIAGTWLLKRFDLRYPRLVN